MVFVESMNVSLMISEKRLEKQSWGVGAFALTFIVKNIINKK